MATTSGNRHPRLAGSPFEAASPPVVEEFTLHDRVCHDSFGLGRVVGVDAGGVMVDFTRQTVRVASPFRRMTKL
jgi:hypothetical protein